MACCARSETISSVSPASTARISARSAGARCAPPEQTAILRSRGARPARRSSRISGLRGSTGCLPQIFLAKHYCTGGSGSSNGRHGSPVQFQQHRGGIGRGHFKLLAGGKVPRFSGGKFCIKQQRAVRQDAHAGGRGSGNGKVEGNSAGRSYGVGRWMSSSGRHRSSSSGLRLRWQERGGRRLLRGTMRGNAPPAINSARDEPAKYGKQCKYSQNRNPYRRAGKLVLVRLRSGHARLAMCEVILGKQIFFVEAQKTRDGAHKSAVENAAGEFLPLFVFEGFKKARTDARGRSDFLQRNFAHLAFTLQAFAKSSTGHESKPVLADTRGVAERPNSLAIASKSAAAGALFSPLFFFPLFFL